MNQLISPRPKISEALKSFRTRYNLTQLSAAKWCLLQPGTYRDYEQGRSKPPRIIEYAITNRIRDYDLAYAKYLEDKHGRLRAAPAPQESAFASA